MSTQPFIPQGKTVLITANTTAPTGVQVTNDTAAGVVTYRVGNPDANETIFYAMSPLTSAQGGAADAQSRAKIPVAGNGNGNYGIPLPAGGVEVIRGPANAFFSGITRTAAANFYVTPGDGM